MVIISVGTGKSVVKALEILKQHNVEGKKVIVLTLFATPDSKFIAMLLHMLKVQGHGQTHSCNLCRFKLDI